MSSDYDDDGLGFWRGLRNAIALSVVLWAIIILAIWFCLIYFNVHV